MPTVTAAALPEKRAGSIGMEFYKSSSFQKPNQTSKRSPVMMIQSCQVIARQVGNLRRMHAGVYFSTELERNYSGRESVMKDVIPTYHDWEQLDDANVIDKDVEEEKLVSVTITYKKVTLRKLKELFNEIYPDISFPRGNKHAAFNPLGESLKAKKTDHDTFTAKRSISTTVEKGAHWKIFSGINVTLSERMDQCGAERGFFASRNKDKVTGTSKHELLIEEGEGRSQTWSQIVPCAQMVPRKVGLYNEVSRPI